MSPVAKLHPVGVNLAQGATEVGTVALFGALVLGAALADAGASNPTVGVACGAVLATGVAVVVRRYLPMTVEVDPAADEVRYRNAWRTGVVRWSSIDNFEPSKALIGYDVARAVCHDGRKVKIRAAPYEEFTRLLRVASHHLPGQER